MECEKHENSCKIYDIISVLWDFPSKRQTIEEFTYENFPEKIFSVSLK